MRKIRMWLLACGFVASPAMAATLLVLNKDDATLSFIDPATGSMLGTVATGQAPHEVEVTSDARTAVVTNYGAQAAGDSLSLIDIATRSERQRVALGDLKRPHGIDSAAGQVYFTAEDAQAVARIDAATGRVDWRLSTAQQRTHMVVASRDGRTLFTTNMGSGSVSIIDRAGTATAKQTLVQVGSMPEGLALAPDEGTLWVANSAGGNVSIVDVRSKALVATFAIGTQRSNRLQFTPDGRLVLVSDLTAGELVIIDAAAHTVRKRLPLGRNASGILVTPDGQRAYAALSGERRLAVIDLRTLEVTGHVDTGGSPDGMAWVP